MPFALGFIGILLLVSGVRNTQGDLFTLLKNDFTGDQNFGYWVIAIGIVGAVGYSNRLRSVSHAFLLLLLIVLFLSNGGFFKKFTDQINSTRYGAADTPAPTSSTNSALPDWSQIFSGAANAPITY